MNKEKDPEQTLIERCLKQDQQAYTKLIEKYKRPVFSFIFRLVRHQQDAEDMAQETFIKIFRSLDSYNPELKFSNWLFKIAYNTTIDFLRRQKPETISLDDEEHPLEIPSLTGDPMEALKRSSLRKTIEQAVNLLPVEYRTVVLLRHREEKSYQEIAEILNLPLGTVKAKVHRARNALRKLLGNNATFSSDFS
ncbi:MAG: sigma-70 family RNA polymerase sigma factor [Candidatus Edwardsbacteria bacterium]